MLAVVEVDENLTQRRALRLVDCNGVRDCPRTSGLELPQHAQVLFHSRSNRTKVLLQFGVLSFGVRQRKC